MEEVTAVRGSGTTDQVDSFKYGGLEVEQHRQKSGMYNPGK